MAKKAKKGPSKTAAGGARKKLLDNSMREFTKASGKKGPTITLGKGGASGKLKRSVNQMSDRAVKSAVKHNVTVPVEAAAVGSTIGKPKRASTFGKGSGKKKSKKK